ncbi:MAG: lipoyl synthase [SAR324 cluster bacterium]|nr:lipoyl synthase [SAR324 cluster bacterium]
MQIPDFRHGPARKPHWLKVKVPQGERFNWIRNRAHGLNLHTVCEEARCPNIAECWQGGTATFMLLGQLCTRGCRFCSVATAREPGALDPAEPGNVAQTIRELQLDYVVLTSVNRDDLPDQGASHFAETVRLARQASPELLVEVLIPDFMGVMDCVRTVIASGPVVIAHNLETVQRLQSIVRDPRANYTQSLDVLSYVRREAPAIKTKSSLMLGFGESEGELLEAMRDLRAIGVDFLTLGQYLQPARGKLKVREFIFPERFKALEQAGLEMGFAYVAAGPLVRSSYRAAEFYIARALRTGAATPT